MIELEKKLLITEEEYYYLLELFGKNASGKEKTTVKQTNYYFDTEDYVMNKQNVTCRIRLKDGKYKGTIKSHKANSDHSTETAIEVRNGIFDNSFIDMGLTLQGELVTERCVIVQDEKYEAVLDKNEYLGYTDYELEIEYLPEYETAAKAIMSTLLNLLICRESSAIYNNLSKRSLNSRSKSQRFFERKSSMKL